MKTTTEIRRLNTCTFDEAVQIWNEGFKGYFVDMTVSLDAYLRRFAGRWSITGILIHCVSRRQAGGLSAQWHKD